MMSNENQKIILLVEDEPILAMSVKINLEKYGYNVIIAYNGYDAIKIFENNGNIDLILMDIDLGTGIDGTEAAEIILKNFKVPIIFHSSHTEPEIVEKTEKITSYGYIVKHSGITVLDASIKMAFKLFEANRIIAESEQRYHTIMSSVVDTILVLENDGRISYINHPSEGLNLEEVIGSNWLDHLESENQQIAREAMSRTCTTGESKIIEFCEVGKNRQMSWFQVKFSCLPNPENKQVVLVASEITERKKAEETILLKNEELAASYEEMQAVNEELEATSEALITVNNDLEKKEEILRESEERYRSLFNNMTEGFALHELIFDDNGKPCDYRFLDINTAFEKLTGLKRENLLGKGQREVLPEEDPFWFNTYCKVALTGESIHIEHYSPPLQRYYEVYSYCPAPNLFAVVFTDITKRKQFEDALIQSEERLELVLQGSKLGFWDWNIETGEVQRNERWAEMLGYTLEEIKLTVKQWTDLIHPEDREIALLSLNNHLEGRSPTHQVEYRMLTKDKQWKWIFDSANVVRRDSQGKPIRMSGTHRDITEQKQVEEKNKSLLLEKEMVLKEVHHRIKNNMSNICGLLDLQSGTLNDPIAIAALKDTENRVKSMMVLYDKLYRTSDFQKISISDYLPPLLDEILSNFPNRNLIRIEENINDFMLDIYKVQPLGIIINELLTNIMKYAFIGKKEGLIKVNVSLNPSPAENRKVVFVSIQDNGNGMPETINFENSPGFGLMLVKMLKTQLNGSIKIERNNGTKIVLEFEQ